MTAAPAPEGVLIEAEDFQSPGGWVVDSQFEAVMGSPYLLAHGLGRPVEDATTRVEIAEAGDYKVWVRTRDWAAPHGPGRFSAAMGLMRESCGASPLAGSLLP